MRVNISNRYYSYSFDSFDSPLTALNHMLPVTVLTKVTCIENLKFPILIFKKD